MQQQQRSRDWCYTLNNYTNEEYDKFKLIVCTYHVIGKEIGESNTPHLQGYIYFPSARTWSATKKKFCERVHIKSRYRTSTIAQAAKYCRKENNYIEIGEEPMSQQEKGDSQKDKFRELNDYAKSGNLDAIDKLCPYEYTRHYNTWKRIAYDHLKKPEPLNELTNLWIYGLSGTGKSYWAHRLKSFYIKECNRWWDNYRGEDNVIIEDLDPKQASFMVRYLKIWGDYYAFPCQEKFGKRYLRPKRIIVTSNFTIEEFMVEHPVSLVPITRRYDQYTFPKDMPKEFKVPKPKKKRVRIEDYDFVYRSKRVKIEENNNNKDEENEIIVIE